MKKIILSFILVAAIALSFVSVYATDAKPYYTFEDGMGREEIPYGEDDNVGTVYGYTSFKMMNEEQAAAAGVPAGYSGWVLALDATANGASIGLDLTNIRVDDIERITFRVWCPEGTKTDGVRITNDSKTSWIMLANPGATGKWVEVVLDRTQNFNTSERNFSVFDDGNGYCKPVNFCFRGSNIGTAYIDSITVELDTTPPVISYEGDNEINTTAGKIFSTEATAYDWKDNASVAPEYIFGDGAVDENGLLLEGEHTCIVRFTDKAGNSAEIEFVLKVEAKDTTKPVLCELPAKFYANTGMRPVLTVTAQDDRDGEIKPTLTWSDGALDSRGRLTEGEHTLTVTATDSTGNKTEKVIPVVVTSGLPAKG
jgi:hypothetical protein